MIKIVLLTMVIIFCLPLNAQALRVVTEDLPPYQIVIDEKLVSGSSFLVVEEMLKRAELDPEIELLPWARAYKIATSSANVIIFSIARNKGREPLFHWLAKLRNLKYHFYSLVKRQDLMNLTLAEALDRTVVAVRYSYEADLLQKIGFVEGKNLILTVTYKDAWRMLLKGRADFTYANEFIESTIFETLIIEPNLFIANFDLGDTSDLYIAASLDTSPHILKQLKDSLLSMQQDGTFKLLLETD
jgi:polar amino acid transport system substrate-binding protein